MSIEEGAGKQTGVSRNENATVQSNEAGQDQKRKNKGDSKSGGNRKESPGKEVEVVRASDEETGALHRKEMEVQGRRKRGRPKRRWLDKVNDDI